MSKKKYYRCLSHTYIVCVLSMSVCVCEQNVWVYFDTEWFFFVKVKLWENLEMQEKKTFTMKCFQHILMKYNYDFFVSYIFVDCGWASFLFIIYWKTIEKCKTILLCIVSDLWFTQYYSCTGHCYSQLYMYISLYICYIYIYIIFIYTYIIFIYIYGYIWLISMYTILYS